MDKYFIYTKVKFLFYQLLFYVLTPTLKIIFLKIAYHFTYNIYLPKYILIYILFGNIFLYVKIILLFAQFCNKFMYKSYCLFDIPFDFSNLLLWIVIIVKLIISFKKKLFVIFIHVQIAIDCEI